MSAFAYMNVITWSMFIVAYMSRQMSRNKINVLGERVPNVFGFIIPAIIFSIFSGLRNKSGDTSVYIEKMEEFIAEGVRPSLTFGANTNFDRIMLWTNDLANKFNPFDDNYQIFMMVTAFVALVPTLYVLYKYSASYEVAIALFVYTGIFASSMNGIRQYFAAGILLMGTKFLLSEKKTAFLYYLPFILIAYTIHSSALIMIPVFFLIRRRSFTAMFYIIAAGSVVIAIAFGSFLEDFLGLVEDTSYAVYSTENWFSSGVETGASVFRALVAAVPLVMAFFKQDIIRERLGKRGDMLINLSLFNFVFYVISVYNWIFARFSIYFAVYFILLVVWLVKYAYEEYDRKTVYGITIFLFFLYFLNMRYSIDAYGSKYL